MSWRATVAGFLLAGTTVLAGPAAAAPPGTAAALPISAADDRAGLLLRWTQPTAASFAAWNAARQDQERWAAYGFDWSTDRCSHAPENPFGFRFGTACRHHDFGYRNYRALGTFDKHRKRLDEVFRADLRRVCDSHRLAAQPPCNALAFLYFQSVRLLGDKPRAVKIH
ncbi:phospholipase [Actinoplanes sp. DH11]|uniref:phospholipase n=1 Tax=Actinoplanes sp. DH11 TaxID=2857011 RepID=UPI001E2CD561|nr:phospholipase [Actinoplanes sp. DH11]